jgi:hypothetical protein
LNECIQELFKCMIATKIIDFGERPYFEGDIYLEI